ncbi:MAG: glycoside hydrolase family 125 protein [Propionibacteriaceae bacterium]
MLGPRPDVLDRAVSDVRKATGDDQIAALVERSMRQNLDAVTEVLDDGTSFVLTGDIPAMWLRDSAAQVRPYLMLAAEDEQLADTLVGVLRRQLAFIALDPYANAFKRGSEPSWHAADLTELRPEVWERKYEIDSLAFPIELAAQLHAVGRDEVIDDSFQQAAALIIDLWERERDHAASTYSFQRLDAPLTDTLTRDGRGEPVGWTGMTWAGFRPSDDACRYHYNVPGNLFAHRSLGHLRRFLDDGALRERAGALQRTIADGIEKFGTVSHEKHGTVYAYEVDGLGGQLLMDDANMPSLLSAPLTGNVAVDDPTYLATRAMILSADNPYYFEGRYARGIGSPHTPERYVWPISLAVQGLTSTSRAEQLDLLRLLRDTTGGTGQMHEGFDVDDPAAYTRPWFSWANAMFCELALTVAGRTLPAL